MNGHTRSIPSSSSSINTSSSNFTSISAPSTHSDKMVSDLRALHFHITQSTCQRDEQLVESLRDHYDDQVARQHRLERAIAQLDEEIEEEEHLVDLESSDDEAQMARLQLTYPIAMEVFSESMKGVGSKRCREKFERKKEAMMIENRLRYEEMRRKYRMEFKSMIDHLEVDSLRLAKMRLD
ncbi:hypothetical protein K501DRAFT_287804 [Backusella circina FSU 941]|nr:hypothetical protein K501DRAFT_287804 [Backusella circina FSU 941]